MSNKCTTHILIEARHESAHTLFEDMCEWVNEKFMGDTLGYNWIGNIVLGSGISKWTDIGFSPVFECRGEVSDISLLTDNRIAIKIETPNSPCLKMWYAICDKYFNPDYNINWYTTNCNGMDKCYTNMEQMYACHVRYHQPLTNYYDKKLSKDLLLLEHVGDSLVCSKTMLGEHLKAFIERYDLVNADEVIKLFKASGWKDYIHINEFLYVDNLDDIDHSEYEVNDVRGGSAA